MLASVHLADVGARSALRLVFKTPKPATTPGLRRANMALAAPLGQGIAPKPDLGRVAMVAFWDDDAALDCFLAEHSVARALASGWHLRLAPLRAYGAWRGLDGDVTNERHVVYDGPAAVLTLGRLRLPQAVRFLRTSAKAEASVVDASGVLWATGMARPPFVATCSLWDDTKSLATYAYGQRPNPAHANAIDEDARKPFHHESAFIRFRPYGSVGGLDGRNPLAESWQAAR